ncbi:MAG TPA: glycosyltransferase family 9 protein [Streptosporangiaceae bacterium]|jgi:ADP-heptose:LPS heptosyltransferase|nr:glycosyltransferase family 9 protein [Streptosporangiaceae bacterium]
MRVRPRVLILRALGLGDFLTGVPAYRALRAALPDHEIVLAAPARFGPLAAATGAVDRVLPAGELQPVRWAWPPPVIAADLHGSGPASHDLVRAVGAPVTMMYASPADPGVAGPRWRDDEHEVARWCRLLGWWGIPADPAALRLPPPRLPPRIRGAAVVHPGAASGSRRWPACRFAGVARTLARRGLPVVITGTAAERPLAAEVARSAGLGAGSVLAGGTGLAGLAAVVAAASIVISNDTGVAHLAVAYGTPSVTLFGPVSPALWGPPRDSARHLALWKGSGSRPGDAHGRSVDPRLLLIGTGDVLDAAGRLAAPAARPAGLAAQPA